jgi:hypothetical protein
MVTGIRYWCDGFITYCLLHYIRNLITVIISYCCTTLIHAPNNLVLCRH